MTGFATCEGQDGAASWRWEARSVNARGFDLRLRLPEGCEGVETECRRRAADKLRRGGVTVQLRLDTAEPATFALDEAALARAVAATRRAAEALAAAGLDVAPVAPERVVALRGVLEGCGAAEDEAARAARDAALLAGFDLLLDRLASDRDREGAALAAALGAQLDEIARLAVAADAAHAVQRAEARARLREKVAALLDASAGLPEDRLAQELALIAVRQDVREEIDRLGAHVAAARGLLAEGGAVGRKLDFLTQEFNREANTLCSKSASPALTEIGLALKVVIDQLREQAQNLA